MNLRILRSILIITTISIAAFAYSQTSVVSGIVKDTKGETLPGVTIIVKETKVGTSTGLDGKYTIKVQKGQTLIFSFVGMKTKTIVVASEEINVALKEDYKELEGVVITGYQKIRNRVFTGAAASIKLKEIKMDGVADVSRMLEGRLPGLTVQNVTGTFGSAPRINIRGGASIIGNVQPLWVVDGAVYEDIVTLTLDQLVSGDAITLISSAISGLNASDIENIQVLKDASATSVYGARALNGVIVITTKSAKKNSPTRITYSYEQSYRLIPTYGEFDVLNSQQTISIFQEMERKGYFTLGNTLYGRRSGIYYQWNKGISTINPSTGKYYYPNTAKVRQQFMREREYANTNWFNELFILKPTNTHTVTLSGGGEHISTYASIGFYDDRGWTITDHVKRITANLKSTFFINEKFKTTLTAQGNVREQKAPGTFSQKKNNTIGAFERDFDINPFNYALGTPRTLRARNNNNELEYYRNNWAPFNIINEYDNNYMDIGVLDFKVQAEASYKIIEDLNINTILSVRNAQTNTSHYVKESSNVIAAFRANETPFVAAENIYLLKDKDNPLLEPQVALTHGGIFNKTTTYLKSYMARIAIDYDKKINQHDIKAFAFTELRYADRTINPFQGYGIQYDRGNQVFTNPLIFRKLLDEGNSYFSILEKYDRGVTFSISGTYGFGGKYIFNTVLSYEGSNTAGQGVRSTWLPTWNLGAKWNIKKEDFFTIEEVSTFALRASYGLTAKMNERAINSNTVLKNEIIKRFNFEDRENALNIIHLENRDLTWEKMYELNIGIDLGFFNNKISATIDVYRRNSFDLIDLVRTSGIGGEYYKYANFGDMRTQGIELALNTKNIKTDNFSWTTNFSASYTDQKITRLLNTPNTFDMVAGTGRGNIVGYPKGSLFSFNYQGVNKMGLPTFDFGLYPKNNRKNPEISGADFLDAQYSKSYLIYHGSVIPNITMGLSNTFKYKNWDLSFFITSQAGNKIRLNPTFDPAFGDLNTFSSEYYNRWLVPYDELKTEVPALPSQDIINLLGRENIEKAYNTYNYSQNRVVDGGFVRMKNISIGYTVPKKFLEKIKFNSLNIRLQATNPFIIYADKNLNGQDPEYYKSGGVSLPTPKQYTLSINIAF